MTTTVNNVQVEFHLMPPKVTFLQGCDMSIAALQDTFRLIEESVEGRMQPTNKIINAFGNQDFTLDGSSKSFLSIRVLQPYIMQFEAGVIPFVTSGGNLLGAYIDSPGAIVQINNALNALNLTNEIIEAKIIELWKLQGLDISNPMTVTPTQRVAGDVDLAITGDGLTTTTVTRQ